MGFVTIVTVVNKDKKLTIEIESTALYTLNCGLCKMLEFSDKIIKVSISDGILLILTEDRDFRNGAQQAPVLKDNRAINNIDAYDWQGNHLWNIGELVGDIKMQFDGFHHISAKDVKLHYEVKCAPSHNLYASISGGQEFIIDSKKQKLLYRIAGKVR